MSRAERVVLIFVVLWASAIWLRLPAWSSDRALWAATVETVPLQARAWVNHCGEEVKSGALEYAWVACQRAIGLTFSPDRPAVRQAIERAKAEVLQALMLSAQGQRVPALQILNQVEAAWPQLEGLAAARVSIESRQ